MIHAQAPQCPVHLGRLMQLVKSSEPLFVFVTKRTHKGTRRMKESRDRKIWRCTVTGCARVEAEDLRIMHGTAKDW